MASIDKVIMMSYAEYLSERRIIREAEKIRKELEIACQALHEYRDVVSTLEKHISANSVAYQTDLRPLAGGERGTGRRAMEALEKMPLACKMRRDAYKKEKAGY